MPSSRHLDDAWCAIIWERRGSPVKAPYFCGDGPWAEIAAIYGGVAEHLADLADDLSRQSWEELAS